MIDIEEGVVGVYSEYVIANNTLCLYILELYTFILNMHISVCSTHV